MAPIIEIGGRYVPVNGDVLVMSNDKDCYLQLNRGQEKMAIEINEHFTDETVGSITADDKGNVIHASSGRIYTKDSRFDKSLPVNAVLKNVSTPR